jgi:arylformamidase
MKTETAEYQYVTGQARPSFAALFEEFSVANEAALAQGEWMLDLVYGNHPRQRIDLCVARGRAKGTVLYFHAGYWQSREKSQFRFLAPAITSVGFNVAFVGYPLCPEVSLAELTLSVRNALPALVKVLPGTTQPLPVIVAGHSAGAHLAVEIALAQTELTPYNQRISGLVPISGIYDLEPLLDTSLNERLRLHPSSAREASPVFRVRAGMPPAAFLVGGTETPAFLEQNRKMAEAWSLAGNLADHHALEGLDHFSLLSAISQPNGPLLQQLNFLCSCRN